MTKEDILERIDLGLDGAVKLFQRNGVEIHLLRELASSAMDHPGVPLFLAAMPYTPSSILNTLLGKGDIEVVRQLALNPVFQPKIAASGNPEYRLAAAQCRRLAPAVAAQLVADPELKVRLALAVNPAIPPGIQLKLSKDPVAFVRLALLENRRLDKEFQIGLGDDCDTLVHACTLVTPRLVPECMKIWSEFDEELGQLALAGRSDLPPPIVERLAQSRFNSVRLRLLERQQLAGDMLEHFAAEGDEPVKCAIAVRDDLTPAILARLWHNGDCSPSLLTAIAANPQLTDELAMQILEHAAASDHELLRNLAANPSSQLIRTRLQMISMHSAMLDKMLCANPQCHLEPVLSALVENTGEEVLSHLAFRRVDCSSLGEAAKARLAAAILPSVRRLAAATAG